MNSTSAAIETEQAAVAQLRDAHELVVRQLRRVIVGQQAVIEEVLITLFAGGHCLLVGVPGLAKTLLIRSLAESLSLDFRRIQFTPDLMPSDITGTEVLQEDRSTGARQLRFLAGPIFGNFILADEINRTPPKTQAALLEAMQERQITAGGQRRVLPHPFFVLATQNPIEHEGTYPLPEAQLDRFMLCIAIDYPSEDDELQIVKQTTIDSEVTLSSALSADEVIALGRIVRRIPIADHIARYAVRLARATRPNEPRSPDFARQYVTWGAGPRASQYLVLAAKARSALRGRCHVDVEDIQAVAKPVLRHRVRLNFNAESENITPDHLVDRLIDCISVIDNESQRDPIAKVFRSADHR
jgi:MoxR-like ATPase